MDEQNQVKASADRIVGLATEVEASSHAALDEASLAQARAVLHQWVDALKGIVVSPAFGRVTLIHDDGQASTIASSELAFRMSAAGVTQSGQ